MSQATKKLLKYYGLIGLFGCLVFLTATFLGPVCQVNPFYDWYYLFAWWPYILVAETLLAIRGDSLLFDKPRRFFLYALVSAVLWLIFEVVNFRLQNWHYLNVPSSIWLRWPGYFISFASVLPGLIATRNLLHSFGLDTIAPHRKISADTIEKALPWSVVIGLVLLIAPLIWPRYFFFCIWGSFLFLLEPVLYRCQAPSLLKKVSFGDWSEVFGWLYAGALCGVLWETWNYWAGSKWYYTIPFVGYFKIFEMPILGFLGFPPFALQCLVMARMFIFLKKRHQSGMWHFPGGSLVFIALVSVFILATFWGLDTYTVVSMH